MEGRAIWGQSSTFVLEAGSLNSMSLIEWLKDYFCVLNLLLRLSKEEDIWLSTTVFLDMCFTSAELTDKLFSQVERHKTGAVLYIRFFNRQSLLWVGIPHWGRINFLSNLFLPFLGAQILWKALCLANVVLIVSRNKPLTHKTMPIFFYSLHYEVNPFLIIIVLSIK